MENGKNFHCTFVRPSGDGVVELDSTTGVKTLRETGEEHIYATRLECLKIILEKMASYPPTRDAFYNYGHNYTGIYNSWLMATGYIYAACSIKDYVRTSYNRRGIAEVKRTVRWTTREGTLELVSEGTGSSSRLANNISCYDMFNQVRSRYDREILESKKSNQIVVSKRVVRVQMDTPEKLTEQGDATQASDKQENTIITMDQAQTVQRPASALDTLRLHTSSEQPQTFDCLTKRWMPLGTVSVTTSHKQGDVIATYYLPESIYTAAACAPNLTPFESYIYGRMDVEMRIVVNANKFHCGKLLFSSKYDTYQADALQAGIQAALSRNHIIVDLSANNEGVLAIPFRYHRPWVRLVKNDANSIGVRPSKYCSVYMHILSPLQTGSGGSSEISVRVFYRFKEAEFTGMSYRVKVQALGLEDVISPPTCRALKEVLVGAERAFDQLGKSSNQDKPGAVEGNIIVPRPRLNFGSGKGIVDVQPLRVNPHTLTNYRQITCPADEPKTFQEMARIWGVVRTSEWSAENKPGTAIITFNIDPMMRSYVSDYMGEITPLEYACANFCFWSGTIELRFDFVSNSFHTGTVQISAEFGRTTATETECESSSTYTKMFHLGEQKSVAFRVPYIYDTVMRRTTDTVFNPYRKVPVTDDIKNAALNVAPLSNTFVKMRVINQLRPVASAPQTISVLTFMRAGPDFVMHGLKNFGLISYNITTKMNNFPEDGYHSAATRAKREGARKPINIRPPGMEATQLPIEDRNIWGEYKPEKLRPKVQMDTGEKENNDSTDNFAIGASNGTIQTMDSHVSFKDLLRRPTLIVYNTIIKSQQSGGFFVPLMPPSRAMSYLITDSIEESNSIWAETIGTTSTKAIMDCFRLWRGGMRYTIVVNSGSKPIYVSLVPHTGVRIVGHHSVIARDNYPLYGCNFNTEIIVPSINPTAVIEAPYDTENTWTCTFDEDSTRNYSWRDKGDLNSGHLVLSTMEDANISIFWSAADDFEVANFYGPAYGKQNGWAYRWDDRYPKVQMEDFPREEPATTVDRLSKVFSHKNMVRAAVSSIPYVGPGLAAGSVIDEWKESLDATACNVSSSAERVAIVAEKLSCDMESVSTTLKLAIERASQTLSGLVNGATLLYDFLLDVLMAWMEKSWKIVAIGILRFVTKIIPHASGMWEMVTGYATQLATYLKDLMTDQRPRVQADINPTSTITAICLGIVGTIFGVTLDPRRQRNIPMAILERLTQSTGIQYLVGVLRFVQGIFDTLRDMVMEALGYVSPEAQALKKLSASNEVINNFIREAQIVTSESNTSCLNGPRYRRRFWKTVLSAHQIQRLICTVPSNCVSGQLARLCNDVIKVGNDKFMDVSASPVRFEPMVICIEGPPGIGKSYATEAIVNNLLTSIGFAQPSSEHIFYRTAGEKFWSGYRDQPVVVYDEWLNVTDPQRCTDMITEFMKLKSTAVFIPEMAHLEEKKIKGNPYLIVMLCNDAFPTVADYARCSKAVFRRRDIVLRCTRLPEFEGVQIREQPVGDFDDFHHLQFQVYIDPTRPSSLTSTKKDYAATQMFLRNRFKNYFAREQIEVKKRMSRLPEFAAEVSVDSIRLEDPFSLFYELNHRVQEDPTTGQNAWTPYEQLEEAVNRVAGIIEEHQNRVIPTVEVPPLMEWSDVVDPAETQMIGGAILGSLMEGRAMRYIASASLKQLEIWESKLAPLRTAVHLCIVCQDQVECAYVCEASRVLEEPHTVCVACYRGWQAQGHTECAMCRSNDVRPILGHVDIAQLALWSRLALKANRGLQWLVKKVATYYQWRVQRPMVSLLTDYLICIAMGLVNPLTGVAAVYSNYVTRAGLAIMDQIRDELSLQSDEWDQVAEPGVSQGEEVEVEEDMLKPALNTVEFQRILDDRVDNPLCLHRQMFAGGVTARFEGNKWCFVDFDTNNIVRVSMSPCKAESCPLHNGSNYKLFIESYINRHRKSLRELYIRYFNSTTAENLNMIPVLLRRPWMMTFTETPLDRSWWEYLTDQWETYRTFILYSLGVGSVVMSILGIYRLATSFSAPHEQFGGTEYNVDSPRHRRSVLRRRGERRYFQSAQENPSVLETVQRHICKNTVKFVIVHGGKSKTMYGVGLFNHYALVPRHYVVEIKRSLSAGGLLTAEPYARPHEKIALNLELSDLIESTSTDLAYIRLPPTFQMFKDLRKYLCLDEDLDKPLPSEAILMGVPGRGKEFMREIYVSVSGIVNKQIIIDQDENAFEVQDVMVYNYSQPGACGSLLVRDNHQRPILSMHFAGAGEGLSGEGYGITLTQEALHVLVQMNDVPAEFEDKHYGSLEDAKFVYDYDVNVHYLGSVEQKDVPYIPTKSNLVRSAIYGCAGLTTILEPAILDKNDKRYVHQSTPLYEGVRKHGILTSDFTATELREAKEFLWSGWIGNMRPLVAQPKVLTLNQAILGFPDIEYYKPMDLKTSAGYPYVCGPRKKKLDYITVIRDDQQQAVDIASIDEQVLEIMQYKNQLRKRGVIPLTTFIDTLKDEKRKSEKARKLGGTRVFCSSPLDYSIECRRHFMHFIASFMKHRMSMMHGVGINPTSQEWGQLISKLLVTNTKFVTIDYSNFGPGYNAGVAEMAYELMIDWLCLNVEGVDRKYLRILVWECIQSTHIVNNTVYQQHGGSPSGAVFTTIVNTLVNQLYIILAWKKLMAKEAINSKTPLVALFKQYVTLFTYGDDLIMTVDPKYMEDFNGITITNYFKQYGIVATNATKSSEIVKYCELSQATFLKRGFLKHPCRRGEWLSPLDWESVIGATQWVWRSINLNEATLVNCQAALLQAHGHGPDKYKEFKTLLDYTLHKKRLPMTTLSWEEIDELFYTTGLEYITDVLINN